MDLFAQLTSQWQHALASVKNDISRINQQIAESGSINPVQNKIFNALGQSPEQFRVIIVGQDPYPNADQAMGLAFSVPAELVTVPPSLKNIQQELASDVGVIGKQDLTSWRTEGVLLLNRILTCETGKSLSHKSIGWQMVTTEIINQVLKANRNTVAILWGKYAQETADMFNPELVIKSVHPSPLSAHRGFFGSKPFSKANKLLVNTRQDPINWA